MIALVRLNHAAEQVLVCFNAMTHGGAKVFAGHLSRFLLVCIIVLTIKALHLSLSVGLSTQLLPAWRIVAQLKSIGRLRIVGPVGSHTARRKTVRTIWSTRLFRYGREVQVRLLVWIECMLLELSSGWRPLRTGTGRAGIFAFMRPPSQTDTKVVDSPPVLPSVPVVYDVDLDVESEWDLSDILNLAKLKFTKVYVRILPSFARSASRFRLQHQLLLLVYSSWRHAS